MTSGPCQETSETAITLNQESNFTRRERSHSLFPEVHWRFQNYSYEFGCQARTTHRWLLEHRWVKRFVWFLDRFHSIYSIGRKTYRRIYVVRGEINKKTADIQARSLMARTLEVNGKARQAEGEAKVVTWKAPSGKRTKIARDLFLRTRNSKKPLRMPVRSWKHQLLLLCFVKLWRRIVGMVINPIKPNQNLHVFWKPVNLQDCVWRILTKSSWRPYCRKRRQFTTTLQFGSQIYSLEKIPAWNLTKVRSKSEVIDEARTRRA